MNSTSSFWSERCTWATQQPLSSLLTKLYASYGSVVAAFSLTTILSIFLMFRILRLPQSTRTTMWSHITAFTGLFLLGSLSGIVAWSFRIVIRVQDYNAIKATDKAQAQELVSEKYRVQGGWFAFYGLEFFCLSLAKLLVRIRCTPQCACLCCINSPLPVTI